VHDSDFLLLHLFDRGRRIDAFDSNPEFSGGRRHKRPDPTERAEQWRAVIGGEPDCPPAHDRKVTSAQLTPSALS
jgi:hypothetical protein